MKIVAALTLSPRLCLDKKPAKGNTGRAETAASLRLTWDMSCLLTVCQLCQQ